MTALELLNRDSTFTGLLKAWEGDGRCPLSLVDYLLELGLDGQAEAARWAATEEDRAAYQYRFQSPGGPFPTLTDDQTYFFWYYNTDANTREELPPMKNRVRLWEHIKQLNGGEPYFVSVLQAFCGLLDGWANYLQEKNSEEEKEEVGSGAD